MQKKNYLCVWHQKGLVILKTHGKLNIYNYKMDFASPEGVYFYNNNRLIACNMPAY